MKNNKNFFEQLEKHLPIDLVPTGESMPHTDETDRNKPSQDRIYSSARRKGFIREKLNTGFAAFIVAILIAVFATLVTIFFIIE
jgi:hypothetical protein